MASPQGKFIWYDLMTTDIPGAQAFYHDVLGWTSQDSGMPDMDYIQLLNGENYVGGIMALPEDVHTAGGRPGWSGYVFVADVDAVATAFVKAGGTIHRGPQDIPGVGRFAVVADPQGAVLVIMTPNSTEQPPPHAPDAPGYVGWHELYAGEWEAAFAFYSGMFGWKKDESLDMGPMGTYQLFSISENQMGGMMTKMKEIPRPFWLYYFNVDELTAAATRVKNAGGQVIHGPQQVPGGSWILHALDPQGAMFALVASKNAS